MMPYLEAEQQLADYFKVFPNPANQFIHLEGKGIFAYDYYSITDATGKVVFTQKNNEPKQRVAVISTAALPEGIYFLVVYKNEEKASFIFLINR